MYNSIQKQIDEALGLDMQCPVSVEQRNPAFIPSCFPVSDLAMSSFRSAVVELAALINVRNVTIDQRLVLMWFDMTLRAEGWDMPPAWDSLAGIYRTFDGWIRLHTNAPHHREAALKVLGCSADKSIVTANVARWHKAALEEEIVNANGAAAAMQTMAEWSDHPQGRVVKSEPLIAWKEKGTAGPCLQTAQVKILDLTRILAGPVATRFLAGFGAQVLRIDPPWWSEPGVEPEVTLGKCRAALDLTRKEDRGCFEHLLKQADVLVHGYRPGALDGLGYGADRLNIIAPHLIDVSLCAYGWKGPWAGRRGFDSLVQMSCGIAAEGMLHMGASYPVSLPVQALDHATGYLMAAAIVRALRIRQQTGQILSARLSLARTAGLLMSQGSHAFTGEAIMENPDDFEKEKEQTCWGPARRLRFPAMIGNQGPEWPYPAGRLKVDAASWQ